MPGTIVTQVVSQKDRGTNRVKLFLLISFSLNLFLSAAPYLSNALSLFWAVSVTLSSSLSFKLTLKVLLKLSLKLWEPSGPSGTILESSKTLNSIQSHRQTHMASCLLGLLSEPKKLSPLITLGKVSGNDIMGPHLSSSSHARESRNLSYNKRSQNLLQWNHTQIHPAYFFAVNFKYIHLNEKG